MAKAITEIRSLARSHTEKALNVLVGIMGNVDAPAAARVQAANSILDRGWGKPDQKIEADHTHSYVARMPARVLDIDEWKKITDATLQ